MVPCLISELAECVCVHAHACTRECVCMCVAWLSAPPFIVMTARIQYEHTESTMTSHKDQKETSYCEAK